MIASFDGEDGTIRVVLPAGFLSALAVEAPAWPGSKKHRLHRLWARVWTEVRGVPVRFEIPTHQWREIADLTATLMEAPPFDSDAIQAMMEWAAIAPDSFDPGAPTINGALAGIGALGLDCWWEQATAFSCTEADAIAALLDVVHGAETGNAFLREHARGDDSGDRHARCDDCEDGYVYLTTAPIDSGPREPIKCATCEGRSWLPPTDIDQAGGETDPHVLNGVTR